MKYIPGPWEVCKEPPNDKWFEGITIGAASPNDARRICDLTPLAPPELRKANGALICAAPDLYEALCAIEPLAVAWASHYQMLHQLRDFHSTHQALLDQVKAAKNKVGAGS